MQPGTSLQMFDASIRLHQDGLLLLHNIGTDINFTKLRDIGS